MNQSAPKNLNLFTIQFPIPAIVSILHRLSGVFLFLAIPFILWGLQVSLTPEGFQTLHRWFESFYVKLILWLILAPFCFHLVAGIRHLLMDIHIGQTLKGGRLSAVLTFAITMLLLILMGIWLW